MSFKMDALIKKASILVEALPYIQKLYGKTVVIKYGGNAMINEALKHSVVEDITLLKYVGVNPIVVHGGGPDITSALKQFHIESKFVGGLRVTDQETVNIARMVLVGKTNKEIVSLFNQKGGKAIGFCGIDGNLIECQKAKVMENGQPVDIGFVGDIVSVDTNLLRYTANAEYIPVIAPIGTDKNGQTYNINADTVASQIACALQAEKLIMLTDIQGILDESKQIIFELTKNRALDLIKQGTINGGMIPKVHGCINAIEHGVNRVHIIDGRIPHCILLEIFTDTGIGSMITQ